MVLLIWQHGCERWKGSRFVWWSSHKVSGRGNLNIFLLKTVFDCKSPMGAGRRIFLIITECLFCILWDCAVHIDPALKSAIFTTSHIRLTSKLVWSVCFREVTTKTHLYCIVKAYVWPTSHTDVQAHGQGAALERSMKPPEDRRILHLVKHT